MGGSRRTWGEPTQTPLVTQVKMISPLKTHIEKHSSTTRTHLGPISTFIFEKSGIGPSACTTLNNLPTGGMSDVPRDT